MDLTKELIDAATYLGSSHRGADGRRKWSRFVLWDDAVRGLGLRITPAGKKSFILVYRIGNRKRQMTLAPYGVFTLKEARADAFRKLAAVIEGKDPLAERQAAAKAETVTELADRYLVEHAEIKRSVVAIAARPQAVTLNVPFSRK
ncbi:MAG: DUF4102 domain-containing protein [bacterium]|nr:DUF4102 domain-containing protein [bacterium]